MEKTYVIVGDNNYWYATFSAKNATEINTRLKDVKKDIKNYHFDNDIELPSELYCYEAELIKTKIL